MACCGALQSCGGKVLQCLIDNRDSIRSLPCQHEVDFYLELEMANYRLDFALVEACRNDLKRNCRSKEGVDGEGGQWLGLRNELTWANRCRARRSPL